LPLSCFTHPLIREGKATTTEVLDRVYSRGKAWISDVAPGEGERLLRACVTHYGTNHDDIDCLIDEMNRALSA
jgi:hypothetical protein